LARPGGELLSRWEQGVLVGAQEELQELLHREATGDIVDLDF